MINNVKHPYSTFRVSSRLLAPWQLILKLFIIIIITQNANAQLTIGSISPTKANTGDTITLSGNGFAGSAFDNFVNFNHKKALVIQASPTQLKAIVPPGTSAGPIMVSKSGYSAISNQVFYPNVIDGNFPIEQGNLVLGYERIFINKVRYVQAADFDGDGWTDITEGLENPGRIIIERNISTQDSLKFEKSDSFSLGANPFIIEIADLNGDGKPDIIVVAGSFIKIFRNNSSPGNLSFSEQPSIGLAVSAYDIVIADFDNDGKLDFATDPGTFQYSLEFFRNNSTEASLSFSKVPSVVAFVPTFSYMTSGDYDNDGKQDIIAGTYGDGLLYIFRNTSNAPGTFSFSPSTMSIGSSYDFEAGSTDLNHDGKTDLVISMSGLPPQVYLNTTTNAAIQFQKILYTGNTNGEGFISFTDLNFDGNPEILSGSANVPGSSGIYENHFPNSPLFGSSVPNLSQTRNFIGADFNNDGKTDLLCSGNQTNRYQVLLNKIATVLIQGFNPQRATDGTPVIIKGQGFTEIDSVSFGEVKAASFEVNNDTTITAFVGIGGSGNITIAAKGVKAARAGFTYFTKPVLQSFSPNTGFAGSEVLLNGTNMQEVRQIRFGGVAADTFFLLNNTQIRAIVGKGSSGEVTIAGSTWDSSKLGGFTFFPAPDITGINSLKVAPGGEVILNGNYFNPLLSLTIGGIKVAPTSATANSISFLAPAQFIGGSIAVKSPYGTDTLFDFYNGATISSVSPLTGKKGDTVTIKGSGFTDNPATIFATIALQKAEVIKASFNEIKIVVPSGPATGEVSVSMNGHTISGQQPFIFSFNGDGVEMDQYSFQSFTLGEILKTREQRGFKIADMDLDGKQDIIQIYADLILVYRNTGQPGLFSFKPVILGNYKVYFHNEYEIRDINHDGKPDFIIVIGYKRHYIVNESTPGNIKFSDAQINGDYSFLGNINLQYKDIDRDGRVDIFNSTDIYLNESSLDSFSFYNRLEIEVKANLKSKLALYDLDGDGKDELFPLEPNPYISEVKYLSIDALRGKITTSNSNQRIPFSCSSPSNFAADLNNDGKIDLVEFCNGSTIKIYKNNSDTGSIQFSPATIILAQNQTFSDSRVADFNGDEKLDFVTFDPVSNQLYFYINNTTESEITFLQPFTVNVFVHPFLRDDKFIFEVADLDNDERPDIIVYTKKMETVEILRNLKGTYKPLFVCKDQPAAITSQGTGSSYQWQQSINGNSFSNLENGNGFSGVQSSMLNIASVNESFNGKLFRCLVNGVAETPFAFRLFNKWLGTTNNLWSEPTNWSCGSVPFGDIEVEIDGQITIDTDVTIGKIVLKPGGNIIVAPGKKLTVLR